MPRILLILAPIPTTPTSQLPFFSPTQVPKAPQKTKIKTKNRIEKEKD